jgi:hypothetical protein
MVVMFLLIANKAISHPLYITITNIEIVNDSVKVNVSIDHHTLEAAINEFSGSSSQLVIGTNGNSNETVLAYIECCLKILVDLKELEFDQFQISENEHKVNILLATKLDKDIFDITIENKLLNNIYGDPKNMVIVSNNKVEKGIAFTSLDTKKTITLVE